MIGRINAKPLNLREERAKALGNPPDAEYFQNASLALWRVFRIRGRGEGSEVIGARPLNWRSLVAAPAEADEGCGWISKVRFA